MTYMLLIMEEGGRKRSRPAEQGQREMERMVRFVEDLKARGIWKASDSLQSASEGVRIEVRGGQRTLRDGPFTEAKEIVGGFILFDCNTREEALAIAGECPAAEWSTVDDRGTGAGRPCYPPGGDAVSTHCSVPPWRLRQNRCSRQRCSRAKYSVSARA